MGDRLVSIAYFLMADDIIFCPLPAGLSGAVITPAILKLSLTSASRLATANSGVPRNTMRKSFFFIRDRNAPDPENVPACPFLSEGRTCYTHLVQFQWVYFPRFSDHNLRDLLFF